MEWWIKYIPKLPLNMEKRKTFPLFSKSQNVQSLCFRTVEQEERKKRKRQSFNDNLHTYPYTNSTIWWYWIDIHWVRIQNRFMLCFASVKFFTVVSVFCPSRCFWCSDFYYCSVYTALFVVRFTVKDCVSALNGILSQFVFCFHSFCQRSCLRYLLSIAKMHEFQFVFPRRVRKWNENSLKSKLKLKISPNDSEVECVKVLKIANALHSNWIQFAMSKKV